MSVEFHVFAVINVNTISHWKRQGGKINFSKNALFLMCYCSFAIRQFLTLMYQPERKSMALKIACSNPRFILDFPRKR